MAQVNPYLNFNGDCEAAFNHYKSVFGGEFTYIGRYGEMPPSDDHQVPDNEKDKIMHVSFPISSETILMGSDCPAAYGGTKFGDNITLSVNAENPEEARRIFDALSEGGKVTMPLDKTFWAALFGMFIDKFGVGWMVNYDEPQQG